MANQTKCKHPGCSCMVPIERAADGLQSCSDFCESKGDERARAAGNRGCGCGHAGCGAQATAHP
jgi:hypothetical protein